MTVCSLKTEMSTLQVSLGNRCDKNIVYVEALYCYYVNLAKPFHTSVSQFLTRKVTQAYSQPLRALVNKKLVYMKMHHKYTIMYILINI